MVFNLVFVVDARENIGSYIALQHIMDLGCNKHGKNYIKCDGGSVGKPGFIF